MTTPTLTIHATRYLESQISDGDVPRDDVTSNVYEIAPDEFDQADSLTPADLAYRIIRDLGLSEPSSTAFHSGVWYVSPDGAYASNYATGEMIEESAHVDGLTEDEARKLFGLVTAWLPSL